MIYFAISLVTFLGYTILKYLNGLSKASKTKFNLQKYFKEITKKENFLTFELLGLIIIILAFNANAKVTEIGTLILYGFLFIRMIKGFENKISFDRKSKLISLLILVIYTTVLVLISMNALRFEYDFNIYENYGYYYSILIIMTYFIYYIIYVLLWLVNLFVKTKKKKKA